MNVLSTVWLGNPLRAWLIALLVALGLMIILGLLKLFLAGRFRRLAARRETIDLYDLLFHLTEATKWTFLLVMGLTAASFLLSLTFRQASILQTVVKVALIVQLGFWAFTVINHAIARRIQAGLSTQPARATTMNALRLVLSLALWTVVSLMVLQNVGVRVDTLIASLGITGIAVGLAVQNILGDLFASLSIALDQPFVIGDYIIVGEFQGTVEHIGLKSTRVRSLSGEQLVFSNSDLLGSRIRNFKRMARRRVAFTLDVPFATPREKLAIVPGLARAAVEAQAQVSFDRAHFTQIGAAALRFEVVYFVESPDFTLYADTQQAINLTLLEAFEREGIAFAQVVGPVVVGK
jgi:small-conductance mechanosensitive channel